MSTKWKAKSGKEYNMRVDLQVMTEIKDQCGVDLFSMPESLQESHAIIQLWKNPLKLVEVLAVAHENQQFSNEKMDSKQFISELSESDDGKINGLRNCFDAFRVEWSSFFLSLYQDKARSNLIGKTWEMLQQASEIKGKELEAIGEQRLKELILSPESP